MHMYYAYRQTKTYRPNYKERTELLTPLQYKAEYCSCSPIPQKKKGNQKKLVMFDRQRANSATEDGKSRSWLTGQYAIIYTL